MCDRTCTWIPENVSPKKQMSVISPTLPIQFITGNSTYNSSSQNLNFLNVVGLTDYTKILKILVDSVIIGAGGAGFAFEADSLFSGGGGSSGHLVRNFGLNIIDPNFSVIVGTGGIFGNSDGSPSQLIYDTGSIIANGGLNAVGSIGQNISGSGIAAAGGGAGGVAGTLGKIDVINMSYTLGNGGNGGRGGDAKNGNGGGKGGNGGNGGNINNNGDNGVYSFGNNDFGQLGNESNTDSNIAVEVALNYLPVDDNVITKISAGGEHSLILTSKGNVYSFGQNSQGQLGRGNTINSNIPVKVLLTNLPVNDKVIMDISAGRFHSLILTSGGKVYSFGSNFAGELGIGTNIVYRTIPTEIAISYLPVSDNIIAKISGGGTHSLILTTQGNVYSFGNNFSGQLGNGSNIINFNYPVQVDLSYLPVTDNVITEISAGGAHSLILTTNGNVYSFGRNNDGELGNGFNISSNVPVQALTSGIGVIKSISAGRYHSLILTSVGTVYSFGNNVYGQLGNNDTTNSNIPVQVVLTNLPITDNVITEISGGLEYSLILTTNGNVYGFGNNLEGQLGTGDNISSIIPVQTLTNNVGYITSISAGATHSLILQNQFINTLFSGNGGNGGNATIASGGNGGDGISLTIIGDIITGSTLISPTNGNDSIFGAGGGGGAGSVAYNLTTNQNIGNQQLGGNGGNGTTPGQIAIDGNGGDGGLSNINTLGGNGGNIGIPVQNTVVIRGGNGGNGENLTTNIQNGGFGGMSVPEIRFGAGGGGGIISLTSDSQGENSDGSNSTTLNGTNDGNGGGGALPGHTPGNGANGSVFVSVTVYYT